MFNPVQLILLKKKKGEKDNQIEHETETVMIFGTGKLQKQKKFEGG